MSVTVERTPNPAAMKFSVGVPVGGPATFTDAGEADPALAPILELDGVRNIFLTSDFVTVSGTPEVDWDDLVPTITSILEDAFG
jgi:hypothetical protein